MVQVFKNQFKESDGKFDERQLKPKDLYALVCGCYPGAFLNGATEESMNSEVYFGFKWQRPGEKWYLQPKETNDQCGTKENKNQRNTKTFKRKSQRRGRV